MIIYAILLMLLTAILAGLPISASAKNEDQAQSGSEQLSMQANAAFQGYFKYGEWLPVWIELKNNGPDLSGEVSVRVSGSGGTMVFSIPVELPTISHKRFSLFVLPNNFTRQLDIQFTVAGELKASKKIALQPQPNISFIIGLIAPQRGALSLINGIQLPGSMTRPIILTDVALSEIPERFEGLRSFDVLVMNDVDTSQLSPEQGQALENWVRQGGRLVIGGGAGMQRTASGLPDSLLPFFPETSIEIQDVSGLSDLSAPTNQAAQIPEIRVPGPFVVATGSLNNGRVLVSQAQIPLLVEHTLGSGSIDLVMLDLAASPFDAWSGTTHFWQQLLSPGASYPNWMPADISARQQLASQMPYSLSNLPMLDLPSAKGLALLLGVYILLVGPVNYMFLRWKKRLHLAWITIPVITIIFSAGSFGLGYALHGADIFLNKIAVIELQPDGKALVTSYIGLFSPGQRAYRVEVAGDGLISPLSPYYNPWDTFGGSASSGQEVVMTQGDPGYVSGLSIEQWSMQSFMVEGIVLDFGKVVAEVHLEEDQLIGTISNLTGYTIQDISIIWTKKFTRIGDLEPGQTLDISLDLTNLSQPNFGAPISYLLYEQELNQPNQSGMARQTEVRRSILEGLIERTPPFKSSTSASASEYATLTQMPLFIGWVDQAPPQVRVAGETPAQQITGVVLFNLPYTFEGSSFSLPAGLIPGEIISFPMDGGSCGESGSTAIYLNRGESFLRFTLPAQFRDLLIQTLTLSIWSDTQWVGSPAVAFYNWQTLSWVELSQVDEGINRITDAANLIAPDGSVQVRLAGDTNMQACFYLGLGLEGKK